MRRSSSTAPWFLVWLALLFFTLRPFGAIDRVVDLVASPVRILGELASPLVFLRERRVSAAEARLAEAATVEAEENERLLSDLARSALPTDPALGLGRRIVHAEVTGRGKDRDHLSIRLRDARGVVEGLPVAFGNAYVGRVARVDSDWAAADVFHDEGIIDTSGTAEVQLVTAAEFHVGARLVDETQSEVLMTVGGVRRARRRAGSAEAEIRLAVHHPSERPSSGGLVRVHELFDEAGDYADLAEGLELGTMQAGAAEDDVSARGSAEREPWIEPQLDYLDGLFHVVVLCPPEPRFGSAIPFETVLRDEHWLRVRPLSVGDPSMTRSTCKIRAGTGKGVRAGAAVTSVGANLIGRVVHAGPASSDVAYLDDPLFNVVAIARFEGLDEPKVLGRLESRGVDRTSGTVRFRWIVRVSLEDVEPLEGDARPARLFTGSADPGLPAGFSFGNAWIPVDARPGEERELEVTPSVDPREVHTLFVRTLSVGERGSSPGAGA